MQRRERESDRDALASLLLYCRMEAERQGLTFSAYLIDLSVESLVHDDQLPSEMEVMGSA